MIDRRMSADVAPATDIDALGTAARIETFGPPPPMLAWRHIGARDGFEVASIGPAPQGGILVHGTTTAVEATRPWALDYHIRLDSAWRSLSAMVSCRSLLGHRSIHLEADGNGRWYVDDRLQPHLDGCLDIDLEGSVLTNAFPVRRAALEEVTAWDAPAAYVRVDDLVVERLDQSYRRTNSANADRYSYRAPAFEFACDLVYDGTGFVTGYPGLSVRVPTTTT